MDHSTSFSRNPLPIESDVEHEQRIRHTCDLVNCVSPWWDFRSWLGTKYRESANQQEGNCSACPCDTALGQVNATSKDRPVGWLPLENSAVLFVVVSKRSPKLGFCSAFFYRTIQKIIGINCVFSICYNEKCKGRHNKKLGAHGLWGPGVFWRINEKQEIGMSDVSLETGVSDINFYP